MLSLINKKILSNSMIASLLQEMQKHIVAIILMEQKLFTQLLVMQDLKIVGISGECHNHKVQPNKLQMEKQKLMHKASLKLCLMQSLMKL